jgi:hypothetical protein
MSEVLMLINYTVTGIENKQAFFMANLYIASILSYKPGFVCTHVYVAIAATVACNLRMFAVHVYT